MRTPLATLALALGLHLVVAPLVAETQQPGKVARVGVLANAPSAALEEVSAGLRDLGWVEGQNLVVERRYPRLDPSAMRTLAAELVGLPVDVIQSMLLQAGHGRAATVFAEAG
jgi:putative ABC transport system substrate-binding protein